MIDPSDETRAPIAAPVRTDADPTIDRRQGETDITLDSGVRAGDTSPSDETSVRPREAEPFDPGRTGGYTPAEGSEVPPPPREFPQFPGYDILGVLGRGGMGIVYRAQHLGLNRTVALKMILGGGHADATALARFRAEALAVARFQHPNLVGVFDVGEAALYLSVIDADVILDGIGSGLATKYNGVVVDALEALEKIGADGRLTLSGGRSFAPAGTFVNAGALVVNRDSTFGTAAPAGTSAGLVSRYAAEGNADDSAGTNHGTLLNGATFGTGLVGQSFKLDGANDYIGIPDSAGLRPTNLTVEGMFKFNSVDVLSISHTLFAKSLGGGTLQSFGLRYLFNNGGQLTAVIGDAANFTTITPNFQPVADKWYHIAMTFDDPSNTLAVYANGVLLGSSNTVARTIGYDAKPFAIGTTFINNNPVSFFKGEIDQVGVYNRALSPAELGALYLSNTVTKYVQTGGTTTVDGTLMSQSPVAIQGGTLRGTGTIAGSLTNSGGTVAPGNSPGFLDITGNYIQGAGGTLNLEIAGRNANAPQFDRLRVSGTADLDGVIRETLLDGFQPTPGDDYTVLTSAGLTVRPMLTYQLPAPGGALRRLAPVLTSTALTFQAQRVRRSTSRRPPHRVLSSRFETSRSMPPAMFTPPASSTPRRASPTSMSSAPTPTTAISSRGPASAGTWRSTAATGRRRAS